MRSRLKDKIAIVTGGQSGLGRQIALRFGKEGANVVIPDLVLEGAQKVAQEIEKMGRKSLAMRTDVSKPIDVKEMVEKTIDGFGRVDILVNNAAILIREGILDHTEEDWNKVLAVNLTGVFLCTKEVVPYMIRQGGGKIINIASIGGLLGNAHPSYAASKGGVINLTRGLALELAPENININCISPGEFRTGINEYLFQADPTLEVRLARTAPARRLGRPEEIASAAVFLGSDESDFCHGTNLVVDGGSICGVPGARVSRPGVPNPFERE